MLFRATFGSGNLAAHKKRDFVEDVFLLYLISLTDHHQSVAVYRTTKIISVISQVYFFRDGHTFALIASVWFIQILMI